MKDNTFIKMYQNATFGYHAHKEDMQDIGTKEGSAFYVTCSSCKEHILRKSLHKNLHVCPKCGHHFVIGSNYRLSLILDNGSFRELDYQIEAKNVLDFPGYDEKIKELEKKTQLREAVVSGTGKINGIEVAIGVLDSRFFMGSMSSVVGEKITLLVEYANKCSLPLIIFSASGGARMQEGIYSLMQMAKTASAVEEFSQNGGFYISCLTNPTTGGVTASFATLGDITIAEPGALVGFAGPRVIEQTIHKKLPEGFQRSEYLEEHGFVDKIVARDQLREILSKLLVMHGGSGNMNKGLGRPIC